MSTYFDLVCVKHKKGAGFHWNHGGEQLHVLAKHLAAWAALAPLYNDSDWYGCEFIEWSAEKGPSLQQLTAFAQEHSDCVVKSRDEYGRWYDQCRKSIRCGECGKSDNCGLSENHDGACGRG